MLGPIRKALARRHRAMVTAEALVWRHGSRVVEMARHAAESPHQGRDDRRSMLFDPHGHVLPLAELS